MSAFLKKWVTKKITIYIYCDHIGIQEMSDNLKKWVTKIGALLLRYITRLIRTLTKTQREKTGIYPAFFMIKLNYIKIHNNIQYTFLFLFYGGYNRVTS